MTVHVNGVDLFYTTHGSGRPLLLMHGGMGLDHSYFRPWLDRLGENCELIYYDHRGNGRSDRPQDWSEVDARTWIDDADALRAALGHERIVVFGHSFFGGMIAQQYALKYPERLDGLILCSAGPAFDYWEDVLAHARRRATAEQMAVVQCLVQPIASDEEMADAANAILPLYFHSDHERYADLFARTFFSAAAYNRGGQVLGVIDSTDRLEEISTPTLVIGGDSDWITPLEHTSDRLHRGLPDSHIVRLDRCGHFPFAEQSAAFSDAVLDWLRQVVGHRRSEST